MAEVKSLAVKDETLNKLSVRIKNMQATGELNFPDEYSPQNALKSAWLAIQDTTDKAGNSALKVCTPGSIYNSLFDMVITGLNPAKRQGYFIIYGKNLVFQRSYFGSIALAKRVNPDIADIVAEVVYEDDILEYEIVKGKKVITSHKQKLEAVDSRKVKGAYCMVINHDGEVMRTDIMTFNEIKQAWKMSKMNPVTDKGMVKEGSVHDKFLAEMVKKTVINRACKPIFNSSDDKYLKLAATRSEIVQAEEDAQEEITEHANQEVIDVDDEPETTMEEAVIDIEPEPEEIIYLYCPAEINKNQPRKPITVCEKCKSKTQCNAYAEYASDREEPEPLKQANGPDF